MPIIGGQTTGPGPGPGFRFQDQPVPPGITYIDPDGGVWPLSDLELSNGYVAYDLEGQSGPPVALTTTPLIRGGAIPLLLLYQPRQMLLGLYAEAPGQLAAGQSDYLDLLDAISHAFDTVRDNAPAPGTLQIQRPDGSIRQISVLVTAGNDQPATSVSTGTEGLLWTSYAFTLEADDPFFTDPQDTSVTFRGTPSGVGILPLLPISLTSPDTFGATVLKNTGTADTYPVWTITGPGTPLISNITTGLQWSVATPLSLGQRIKVTTQPGFQSAVNIDTGDSVWSNLVQSTPRALWPLVHGDNHLLLTMSGSTSASRIKLSYRRRWKRA